MGKQGTLTILIALVLGLATTWGTPCTAKEKAAKRPATIVDVAPAKAIAWQAKVTATGTLVAEQGVTVKAATSGRVTKIFFKSGQYVQKGAPLVQLYPDILQARLKSAQAQLTLSQLDFKRYARLYKQKTISQAEFDKYRATLTSNQAQVNEIKAELDMALIRAPFSGYLGIRQVNLGDYLSAGQAIVNLQDTDPMFVDFNIPERYLSQLKIDAKVQLHSNTYGKRIFTGSVVALGSQINPQTRTIAVRAQVPNKDHTLVSGSFVEVALFIGQTHAVVTIPQAAISYSAQGNYVFQVKKGKAIKTKVKLGVRNNKNIIVLHGLTANAIVVTAGQIKLHNGAAVKIRHKG